MRPDRGAKPIIDFNAFGLKYNLLIRRQRNKYALESHEPGIWSWINKRYWLIWILYRIDNKQIVIWQKTWRLTLSHTWKPLRNQQFFSLNFHSLLKSRLKIMGCGSSTRVVNTIGTPGKGTYFNSWWKIFSSKKLISIH